MNIYLTGVGGQGIGLISEILMRAADHAGFKVKGVDTHGLAQRGGVVASHLRIGEAVHAPLVRRGQADLVVALERHEALRGAGTFLRDGGTLIYYNTVWQPLAVRLREAQEIKPDALEAFGGERNIKVIAIIEPDLPEARMQNIALLAGVQNHALIPRVECEHYQMAMEDLMAGAMLAQNMALFNSLTGRDHN